MVQRLKKNKQWNTIFESSIITACTCTYFNIYIQRLSIELYQLSGNQSLPLRVSLHFVPGHFIPNILFPAPVISSPVISAPGHFVSWSFCPLVILSPGHFVSWSFRPLVISSPGHFVSWWFRPLVISSPGLLVLCHFILLEIHTLHWCNCVDHMTLFSGCKYLILSAHISS
jgi:hypothetical protein